MNPNIGRDFLIQRAEPVERSAASVTARALSAIDASQRAYITPNLITAGDERDPEEEQQRVQPDVLPTNELTPAQNLSSSTSTPNSLSSDHPSQSRRILQTLSQGASPASPQDRSLGAPSPATITGHPVDDLLLTSNSQKLLVYCVLHAVLGLTACHLHLSPSGANQVDMATALQHRVAALNGLSSLLIKEEIYGLTEAEEEAALAIIFLLVLHDVSSMIFFKFFHSKNHLG
ncbi:C6 zinc finger protein [Colletotrichum fioriniae PJ7]|uniref:C6 zinc finger protein n=1 Tax=Colletotrichum fioriniae PJ7 TaxID=1445577 RepID=A0A010QDX3_9PEZI|nr:C6 zinc finger protein [Colletotrichum fioriniae PJ7]